MFEEWPKAQNFKAPSFKKSSYEDKLGGNLLCFLQQREEKMNTILLFVPEIKFDVEFRCDGSLYAYVEFYSSNCFINILVNA